MNALETYLFYKESLTGDFDDYSKEEQNLFRKLKDKAIEEFKVTEEEFGLLLFTRQYPQIFRRVHTYILSAKALKESIGRI